MISKRVRVVNPDSLRYHQIGELIGILEIYGLSLEKRIQQIEREQTIYRGLTYVKLAEV